MSASRRDRSWTDHDQGYVSRMATALRNERACFDVTQLTI